MLHGARVAAGMATRRAVAAERHTARLARAQMEPATAVLDALLANAPRRVLHLGDGFDMSAGTCHVDLSFVRIVRRLATGRHPQIG